MKPITSREKIPKIFSTKKLHRRGMFSHRSVANIKINIADILMSSDASLELNSAKRIDYDERTMGTNLNSQRDTPSFGG